jgi:hypothetical protein
MTMDRESRPFAAVREIPVVELPDEARCIPFAHVARRGGGRIDLHVSGALPPGWVLRLARGFAERRVNLLNGRARHLDEGIWNGALEVELGSADRRVPDFLALALGEQGAGRYLPAPPLLEVAMVGGAHGLEVEVHAWDAVGLLASVLGHVEAVGLVPREVLLETEGDCAFHQLTLVDARGAAPGRSLRRALARRLAGQLRAA